MNASDALELLLSVRSDATVGPRSVPLRIVFANHGEAPVRLLAEFEPLPVFFAFRLVKADGTPVALPGGGKIDFGPARPACEDLAPGETHAIDVDVGTLLAEPLDSGRYSLSAAYHNQYGEGCFKGTLESNAVDVEVPAA
jgi:hypothetical protein